MSMLFGLFSLFSSICTCITIVRVAKDLTLSAPPLPKRDESGLRNLSDYGGQVLLVVAVVAWRRGLGVSISILTALSRGLTLIRGSLVS